MNQGELLLKHKERIIKEEGMETFLVFATGYKRRIDLFDLLTRYEAEDAFEALKYEQKLKNKQPVIDEIVPVEEQVEIAPAVIREDQTGKINVLKRSPIMGKQKKKGRHK